MIPTRCVAVTCRAPAAAVTTILTNRVSPPDDGGQWTETGSTGAVSSRGDDVAHLQLAQFSPERPPIRPGHPIVMLLSIFAALSARNTRQQRAIFEFNARQFLKDPNGELNRADVDRLNRDQVKKICGRLEDVQKDTDDADRAVG